MGVHTSLFNGKLQIGNQLKYDYNTWNYPGAPSIGRWYTRPYASWYFGNCSLYAGYSSPQKYPHKGGSVVSYTPHQCELRFSYGNGNFNLMISASNIFDKRFKCKEWFASGPYRYERNQWTNGRSVSVSLTYTFDYGKKVEPGVDISTQNVKSSAILGSE